MSLYVLSLMKSTLIGLGLLLILFIGLKIVMTSMGNRDIPHSNWVALEVGIVFVMAGIFINYKFYEILDNKVENGYAVYLDGKEVETEDISFTQYNVTVNDEDKTIYLSQSTNDRKTFIPIFIHR